MATANKFISSEIDNYIAQHASPLDSVLLELHKKTQEFPRGFIQSSLIQAVVLQILVKSTAAKAILEIGTLAGFSALAMAMAMPEDGKVYTCDISDEYIKIGKPYWEKSGVDDKINVFLDDADKSLDAFLQDDKKFDLCYIDANKSDYLSYYEKCYQLTRKGGLIIMDNTLWSGKVVSDEKPDNMLKGIKATNDRMVVDERIQCLILPIGDGMSLIYKE